VAGFRAYAVYAVLIASLVIGQTDVARAQAPSAQASSAPRAKHWAANNACRRSSLSRPRAVRVNSAATTSFRSSSKSIPSIEA
jgi:hypothetical protein